MSKVVLILMATSAGLGLLSLHLVKEMRAGQATIAELQAQLETVQKQEPLRLQTPPMGVSQLRLPADITPPTEEARGSVATSPFGAAPPRPAGGSSLSPRPAGEPWAMLPSPEERRRMMREHQERQRALMEDPDYREAMRVQNRSNFARSYPGVAQELGLDPQQTNEFFDLLAEQQQRSTELMQPMWDVEGKDPAAVAEQHRNVQEQAGQLQRQNEAEFAARLGQDKLQAWKDYQSTLGYRHQLEQMRTTLASQGLPLSEDVRKPLIKALADAGKATAEEFSALSRSGMTSALGLVVAPSFGPSAMLSSGSSIEQQLEMTRKSQQRTLDAISPYLSYEQRQAIQQDQEAQLKLQQAHLRLMRAQENSGANAVIGSQGRVGLSQSVEGQRP